MIDFAFDSTSAASASLQSCLLSNLWKRSRKLWTISSRMQDSETAPGKPWRNVQICKALFVWERLMGMILIVIFAIAVSKTIILGS